MKKLICFVFLSALIINNNYSVLNWFKRQIEQHPLVFAIVGTTTLATIGGGMIYIKKKNNTTPKKQNSYDIINSKKECSKKNND